MDSSEGSLVYTRGMSDPNPAARALLRHTLATLAYRGGKAGLAGGPVRGENYYKAEIVAGRVGAEQTPAPRVRLNR